MGTGPPRRSIIILIIIVTINRNSKNNDNNNNKKKNKNNNTHNNKVTGLPKVKLEVDEAFKRSLLEDVIPKAAPEFLGWFLGTFLTFIIWVYKAMVIYGPASVVSGPPPPPPMVWSGRGGGGADPRQNPCFVSVVPSVEGARLGETHVMCVRRLPPYPPSPLQAYGLQP